MTRSKSSVTRVVPGLWMASASVTRRPQLVLEQGIDHVVDLRAERESPGRWLHPMTETHVPLEDHGSPSVAELRFAGEVVARLVRQGHEVLVHCRAGVERTPTVVCAALMLMGWPLDMAYRRVNESRPAAAPTDGQLAALRGLADELRTSKAR